ncbi:hypothetical protein GCK72_005746 [Caenorhabditis remanei]|uniref:Probable RNA polymerase II nuclear localization protein SLC7A6OS n=1 Tax=Caenorhabditis remanei TaxID=31234 RepID=A0A6A5HHE1_CAERE|nr:hypothetical protein GCK72_005746 [Caenorhabditis remanei]KAF1765793.1 hypothetical protein GCK72_005746 [Caenorhabditis remanei]
MSAPLIRVSRKRTADPHEALILHTKRAKQAAPLVFTLFKAAASGTDEELTGARVVDLPRVENRMEDERLVGESSENPLGFVKDEAVGLVGEVEKQQKAEENVQVSLNGRLLLPVTNSESASAQDDVVYDYYAIHEKPGNAGIVGGDSANWEADIEGADVRFANRDELDLGDDDDSDGPPADDEDDSNDEDNWRNDYPDEDSYDEDSDHGDPYGMLEPGRWHVGEEYADESFNRRLQNMDLNEERYESYFEGEDTDDDGE